MDRKSAASPGRFARMRAGPSPQRLACVGLAVFVAVLQPFAAMAQAGPSVPVRVGGDWEFAACSDRGTINASQASADFVPVNSTPTPSLRPIGRLSVGEEVYVCDRNGPFIGVIYGEGDCGLVEPIARRAAYRGDCSSGWVHNGAIDPSDPGAV